MLAVQWVPVSVVTSVVAVDLLTRAGDYGRQAARQLAQLLRFKSPAQYDPAPVPQRDAAKAVELARRLVERAALVNSARPPGFAHESRTPHGPAHAPHPGK